MSLYYCPTCGARLLFLTGGSYCETCGYIYSWKDSTSWPWTPEVTDAAADFTFVSC